MAQDVAITGKKNDTTVRVKFDHEKNSYPKTDAPSRQNKTTADSRRENGTSHPGTNREIDRRCTG